MRSWMIGFVLGVLPVLLLSQLPSPAVAPLVAALGLLALRWPGIQARFCSGLALGCALALWQGTALLEHRIGSDCVRLPIEVSGEVASLPRSGTMPNGDRRQRFEFRVQAIEPASCRGPRLLLLSYYGPEQINPGDTWVFPVSLSRPWGLANPGSFNLQAWYAETGIDAVGSVRAGPAARLPVPPSLASLPNRLRQQISERLASLPLEPQVRGTLAALTVADKSGIDRGLWTLLQQFGINHLLVISGLHVGMVAAAAYLLGNLVLRPLLLLGFSCAWLPALLALLLCTAYTALAGFSVATQRALCMLTCFLLAGLLGRSTTSARNLLVALAAVLALNPLAALGSGFWLSFGAVAALLWLGCWQRHQPGWQRLLWTHGFMSLAMLPLGAWWFGGSSLVAALANLLMVPLVGLFVVPLALLGVLAMYPAPGLATTLWQVAAWPLQQILPLAEALSAGHGRWLYQQFAAGLPEVLLGLLGVALLVAPVSLRLRALAALLPLPLLLPLAPGELQATGIAGGVTRVTVLDVGQGTAVVVRGAGRSLVYDTGGGDPAGANMAVAVVLPYLRQQGVRELDTLVISHPDNDHSAGAASLLAALPVDYYFFGGASVVAGAGRPCVAGQAWRWPGGQQFQFLSPATGEALASNDYSCVLQLEAGGHRLLLVGDIEAARERELVRYWGDALASDWLLVGHHGSRTSSSWALLKTAAPGAAVISRGYANRFGHPHADVLQRLQGAGASIYDTADGGALEFELVAGQPLQVRRYRQVLQRFWM